MISPMLLPRFEYEAPDSLDAVVKVLAEAEGQASLLAGGTDLLVKMKHRQMCPRLVVSLGSVGGLGGVERDDAGGLRLGPLATMTRLAGSPVLAEGWTAVAEGAAVVGGPVIRNRATVGGNIVNARPCADTVPGLLALGASLRLLGLQGERVVPLEAFITGPGQTLITPDEVLRAIEAPARRDTGSCYLKITRRATMEVTICGCAAAVTLDEKHEQITRARLVFTSVAPVPLRVKAAEAPLVGQPPDDKTLAAAAAAARKAVAPISDHRAPDFYRFEMVEVTARRALQTAVARARGEVTP